MNEGSVSQFWFNILLKREGMTVMVTDVTHAERHAGRSNYNNTRRALVGIVDLLGVAWLMRRRRLATSRVVLRDDGADDPASS